MIRTTDSACNQKANRGTWEKGYGRMLFKRMGKLLRGKDVPRGGTSGVLRADAHNSGVGGFPCRRNKDRRLPKKTGPWNILTKKGSGEIYRGGGLERQLVV